MRVSLPVLYHLTDVRERTVIRGRCGITVTTVEVPETTASDAPVAASMTVEDGGNTKRQEFRVWGGRLWHNRFTWNHPGIGDVVSDRTTAEWIKELREHECEYWFNRCELLPSWMRIAMTKSMDFVVEERPSIRARNTERTIQSIARRTLVIDGQIWRESPGPMLVLTKSIRDRPYFEWRHPRDVLGKIGAMPAAFRIGEEAIAEAVEPEHFAYLNPDYAPDVSGELPPFDIEPIVIEAAAWEVLSNMTRLCAPNAPRALLQAVLELRDALASRYPERSFNFNPLMTGNMWPHELDEIHLQPATDLIPVLRQFTTLPSGIKGISQGAFRAAELVCKRIDATRALGAEPVDLADADALALGGL